MEDDLEALAILRADICKLFPAGPARERWLAWAERLCDDGTFAEQASYLDRGRARPRRTSSIQTEH